MNPGRLLLLADFLDKLPRERFDYGVWVGRNWGGKQDLSCGTPACALGWAATIPELREAGLCIVQGKSGPCVSLEDSAFGPEDDVWTHSLYAARTVFDLDPDDVEWLFVPRDDGDEDDDEDRPLSSAHPADVAAHIRAFVDARVGA